MEYVGEIAAIGTSVCFSIGSTVTTFAGRQLGAALVNRTRLVLALLFVVILHWLSYGQPFPIGVETSRLGWLGLSGLVGLVLGDAALFQAFVLVGPRLSMLMMALAPAISVVLAWVFLRETLAAQELVGITLTLAGIIWVVAERQRPTPARIATPAVEMPTRQYALGLLFGLGGAVGQAVGYILSKLGLAGDFPALSGNLIRLAVACAVIWAFTLLRGQVQTSLRRLRDNPRGVGYVVAGTLAGPVTGVWLSLVAVQRAPVGVASTLTSLTPIFLLPVSHFVFGEKITRQAVLGTILAFAGTALLFL